MEIVGLIAHSIDVEAAGGIAKVALPSNPPRGGRDENQVAACCARSLRPFNGNRRLFADRRRRPGVALLVSTKGAVAVAITCWPPVRPAGRNRRGCLR